MLDAVRRAFTLAHLTDGPARALAIHTKHRQARQGKPYDGRLDLYPTFILHLLGHQKEVMDYMRPVTEKYPYASLKHLAGLIPAERLAASAKSRYMKCECHFFIAMNYLSEGDRANARIHFEKSVATRILWFLEYEWSRSFLAQMDRDPNWPPWIPAKE